MQAHGHAISDTELFPAQFDGFQACSSNVYVHSKPSVVRAHVTSKMHAAQPPINALAFELVRISVSTAWPPYLP